MQEGRSADNWTEGEVLIWTGGTNCHTHTHFATRLSRLSHIVRSIWGDIFTNSQMSKYLSLISILGSCHGLAPFGSSRGNWQLGTGNLATLGLSHASEIQLHLLPKAMHDSHGRYAAEI